MSATAGPAGSEAVPLLEDAFTTAQQRQVLRKLTPRVVYLSMGIIMLSAMDRVNVAVAASDLCKELDLTHSQFGRAIGLFYVGNITSQVASNVMLQRFGAPFWLSFIVFSWGCVATGAAFIQSPWQLYFVRILLGITEGGAFPGCFYYLSLFFPEVYIEEAYAGIFTALYFASPLSVPLAAGLLRTDGIWGTTGWRNLFFVEGLIPIAFSVVLFFSLPKSVDSITFLDPEEKEWLMQQHEEERRPPLSQVFRDIAEVAKIRPFWCIVIVWSAVISYYVVLANWITLILHEGLSKEDESSEETCGVKGSSLVGDILTAVPYAINGLVCYLSRTQTTKIRNRTAFTALVLIVCAVLMTTWSFTRQLSFVFGFLSLTGAISFSGLPNLFASGVALTLLRSEIRSTGMALGNATASIASIVLPMIVGVLVDGYGYGYAMLVIAGMMAVAAFSSFVVKDPLLDVKTSIRN